MSRTGESRPALPEKRPPEPVLSRLVIHVTRSAGSTLLDGRGWRRDRTNVSTIDDLTIWKREMADLSGIAYGGVSGR